MSDWITDFVTCSDGANSPHLYRLWCGISCLAGALERRVWVRVGKYWTYPNLYVLLVGSPATGKGVVDNVREMWSDVQRPGTLEKAFHVAPSNTTKAALVDCLSRSKQIFLPPTGAPYDYHSLLCAAEEFSSFLPAWDMSFIATLTTLYNCPITPYSEERRTGTVRQLVIERPVLNLLGGVQPTWLQNTLPEDAWGQGLMTRTLLVYQAEGPVQSIFNMPEIDPKLEKALLKRLAFFSTLYGQMKWMPDAQEYLDQWQLSLGPPTPTHPKLQYYNRRRPLHVIKLSMISAISRGAKADEAIELLDVQRSIRWLLEIEALMPNIFREMVGKSDRAVIEELYFFTVRLWSKAGGKAVPKAILMDFLSSRVPGMLMDKIFSSAVSTEIIMKEAALDGQELYVPNPRHKHGVL